MTSPMTSPLPPHPNPLDAFPESGKFIVLEGADGVGKTTHAKLLAAHLQQTAGTTLLEERKAMLAEEPGGTPLGQELKKLILDASIPMGFRTLQFLFLADRAQHCKEVLWPNLKKGVHIVSSRFYASQLIYAGYQHGESVKFYKEVMNEYAIEGLHPDLTILLDPTDDWEVELNERDRIEKEGPALQLAVRIGFRQYMARKKDWKRVVVSPQKSIAETQESIQQIVKKELGLGL